MWEDGRPRYWIGGYDRWHLVLPAALLGVLIWLFCLPQPPALTESVRAVAPVPLVAPTLESPAHGAQLRADRLGEVDGRAQFGTGVVLFYATAQPTWRELGRMAATPGGRYRFGLTNFPAGVYRLRTIAWLPDGRKAESAIVEITVVPAPKPVPPPGRRRRAR